jgi:SAM-dependent methyltransferase
LIAKRATPIRPAVSICPLCESNEFEYQFVSAGSPLVRCEGCGLLLRNPQPSDSELEAIYNEHYFLGSQPGRSVSKGDAAITGDVDALKRDTAAGYLDAIEARLAVTDTTRRGLRLLEVGPGLGNLLVEAQSRGYDVTGVEFGAAAVRVANQKLGAARVLQGSLDDVALPSESFDVCVLADVLEHTRDPRAVLLAAWRVLKPGGLLFIAVPSLDSWSARLMRAHWMEFKLEHLFFFETRTLESLLFRCGFEQVTSSAGRKTLSPGYVIEHFDRFPVPVLSPLARLGRAVLPGMVRERRFNIVASGIDVMARRTVAAPPVARRQRLSVIMPVFNERTTFPEVTQQLLRKEIAGLDIELIVVESNSDDGTRDEVRKVERHERVMVLYEDRPRGKGHAVRTGLAAASGDFVLIQDADLEYDLNDYEVLLEPLRSGRAAFVLGARHGLNGQSWKMRHFTDQVLLSTAMNFGHLFFTALFNVVYGTWLRDPFTMYKVFRRDCLYGISLESNRFDLDWEIVGKLVRAGYRPLEIPVNYASRSFAEGKKVSIWRDPFSYFRACFKYRFQRLGKNAR